MFERLSFLLSSLGVVATLLGSSTAFAGEPPLASGVQVVLLKKIFQYDRELERREIRVTVLHPDDAGSEGETLAAAFRSIGVNATAAKLSTVASALDATSVLYAWPGAMNPAVKELCIRKRILTVSGQRALAEKGEVSVSLARSSEGKSEIIVNLRSVKDESHSIAATLLALAVVIK